MIIFMQSCPLNWNTELWVGLLAGLVLGFFWGAMLAGKRQKKGSGKSKSRKVALSTGSGNGPVEIHVGNLNYDLSEDQLRAEFEKFGKVKSARIITHRQSQRSKGFGFVEMQNRNEADRAIKAMNNKEIMGREIRLNEARGKVREDD